MKKENFVTLIMSVVGGLIFMIVRANICLIDLQYKCNIKDRFTI